MKKSITASNDEGQSERAELFRDLGLRTMGDLQDELETWTTATDVVEGLVRAQSINILAGESGIGKTPLLQQIGLCVAAGVPFLGRPVQRGLVIYLDGESSRRVFLDQVTRISKSLGLTEPPDRFLVWNRNWLPDANQPIELMLKSLLLNAKPTLVIVDPLRVFWPSAESKNEDAVEMFAFLRQQSTAHGCAWQLGHHLRKIDKKSAPPDLMTEPARWLQEVAGARALVNQSDTRLGVEAVKHGRGDLQVAGVGRSIGSLGGFRLGRLHDEQGDEAGYELLSGIELLSPDDRVVWDRLPVDFKFTELQRLLGNSGSNTKRVIEACLRCGVIEKTAEGYHRVVTNDRSTPGVGLRAR